MRIAYGIHGYGRGHASRAQAVLPALASRHDLLILAGGDALDALESDHPILRIPTLEYCYDSSGAISRRRTLRRNLPGILDLFLKGPSLELVMAALKEFRPDVVVSDSEPYTHRAARALGIPRISFDNYGVLVHCRPALSGADRFRARASAAAYRILFGRPERAIVANFTALPSRRPDVCVVGAVIRPEVRAATPQRGEHLLVYLSKGEHEFTPRIEQALLGVGVPIRVYGTPRRGLQANLQFKPPANLPFIEDLATCRAVFGTTGNQLLGEVRYFGKPMLGMPIDCLEQRMNAVQLEQMGFGQAITRSRVTAEAIRGFLVRADRFGGHDVSARHDGAEAAVEAIERYAAELATRIGRRGARSGAPPTESSTSRRAR